MADREKKQAAHSLKEVGWPDCADRCSAIEHLGAGECDSVCPFKFEEDNND